VGLGRVEEALPVRAGEGQGTARRGGLSERIRDHHDLTAWPGRGFLPDVGEAVATYWEKIGVKVKRRPVDRAVFAADFRARAYSG